MRFITTLIGMLLTLALPCKSALADTPPANPCGPILTQQGSGFILYFPYLVAAPASTTPGVQPGIYQAHFIYMPAGNLEFQLQDSGMAQNTLPDGCQAPQLLNDATGNWAVYAPFGTFGAIPFSGFLDEQARSSLSFLAAAGAPVTAPPAPGGQLKCVGVTHYSGYSVINPVVFNITNADAAAQRTVKWTSDNGLTPQGGGFSYSAVAGGFDVSKGMNLAAASESFVIYNYGTYTGSFSVTTAAGSASVRWSVTVTATEVTCSVNPN